MEGMFSLLGGRTEPLRDVEERTDGDLNPHSLGSSPSGGTSKALVKAIFAGDVSSSIRLVAASAWRVAG
jgi:hypothetical protein